MLLDLEMGDIISFELFDPWGKHTKILIFMMVF